MKALVFTCSIISLLPSVGYSWSAPGHEAIAIAAMQMLQGTPAEGKVKAILAGENPTNAAIWLDLVREKFQFADPAAQTEADNFANDFTNNSEWHFCNFIVGSTNYDFGSKYAAKEDVVHALKMAIDVLEGSPSKMNQREALRAVFHLVGDIHQPLHCITGFFDISDTNKPTELSDVADPATATQDRGGNQLFYTKSENLHHYWDLVLPASVAGDVPALASVITTNLASQELTPGDFHNWPEVWAGQSIPQANAAYDKLTFTNASFVVEHPHSKPKLHIATVLPGGQKQYKSDQQSRAQEQLTLAAVHLAQLLSKINFNP